MDVDNRLVCIVRQNVFKILKSIKIVFLSLKLLLQITALLINLIDHNIHN